MTETVLITGASSGIGAELALAFAADGARTLLTGRSAEGLSATAARIRAAGGSEPRLVVADLATPDGVEGLLAAIADETVDVLVDNAGFGLHGPALDLDRAAQLAIVDVNARAATALALALLPGMVARRRGGVLFVASVAGLVPGGPFFAVYYASKAYLVAFAEALAVELAGTGVTITTLCPGPTATAFGRRAGFRGTPAADAAGRDGAPAVAAAGHRGFRAGRGIVITGRGMRLAALLARVLPRRVMLSAIARAQAARR